MLGPHRAERSRKRLGEVLTDALGRGLPGFSFQALPRAWRLMVITSEQGGDGLALKVIECVINLLVSPRTSKNVIEIYPIKLHFLI